MFGSVMASEGGHCFSYPGFTMLKRWHPCCEAFAIQGCQALLSRGCMQPVCGSFSGGACICTGHISPSRAYLGCQILKKQKVSRLN